MRATEFEFRYRSLLNLIHFWLAFQVYAIDHVNVVQAVVAWTTGANAWRAQLLTRALFAFGVLLVGLAAGVRTWAAAYLRSEVVHDRNLHTEILVADGPYRYVRNPLYLGTFLLSVGMGFLASRLGFVILAAGGALRILRLVGREEAELEKQQEEGFREFCRRVPRLLPSFRPRVPAGGLEPRWGQAFGGEAFMWGFFISMLAFTITLQLKVAWILAGATLVLWFLQNVVRIGRTKPA